MDEIYVPNCATFLNNNTYLGSYHGLRFKLTPDVENSTLQGELWHGELCYELSKIEETSNFPITTEGLEAATQWLLSHVDAACN